MKYFMSCFQRFLQASTPLFFLCLLVFLMQACGTDKKPPLPTTKELAQDTSYLTPPQNNTRDWLTIDELNLTTASKPSPYHNQYFMPIGSEKNASHSLNGQLHINGGQLIGFPSNYYQSMKTFPTFNAHVVSHQGYLIPENRDIIISDTEESYWRIILSPGKVWQEDSDNGMSRASFPFVMVERAWNTTFNGIATFLFDDSNVSNVRVQLVQHTAPGFTDEAAGTFDLTYMPTPEQNNHQAIQAFEQELAQQLPVENWQTLKDLYPDLNWQSFNGGLAQDEVSAAAIWFNDRIYSQPCATPYGDYPFCQFMRHGVYSATKSAAGAVALSHLAQRYGEEVLDYLIKDYIEITASHNGWDNVTFKDALDMATGIGNNEPNREYEDPFADENGQLTGDWSRAKSAKEKLDIALNHYGNFPWGPGEVFRYNTNHTYVLSAAMDALVRQREGIGLWQLLKQNVYQPIGIMHSPMMHTTEPDGSRGVPILGVGLYPTMDDMMKIVRLLHQEGEHQGAQLLHRETVKKALFRTDELGLISHVNNNEFGKGRYLLSFFGLPYQGETGCQMQVPTMSGAGGNYVTILPNGIIAVRFADENNHERRVMVDITSQLSPICP